MEKSTPGLLQGLTVKIQAHKALVNSSAKETEAGGWILGWPKLSSETLSHTANEETLKCSTSFPPNYVHMVCMKQK